MTPKKRDKALLLAIEQAGGPSHLRAHIKRVTKKPITTQAISQWRQCPDRRVLQVTSAPGVTIKPHELRPDIYPTK